MATIISTTRRRSMLSAIGFTGLTMVSTVGWLVPDSPEAIAPTSTDLSGAGQLSPNPDARLLKLVAAYLENDRQFDALHAPWYDTVKVPDWVEEQSEPLVERSHRLRRLIGLIPARTRSGLEAKARAALAHAYITADEDLDEESDSFMAHSLCRDLLRGVA